MCVCVTLTGKVATSAVEAGHLTTLERVSSAGDCLDGRIATLSTLQQQTTAV